MKSKIQEKLTSIQKIVMELSSTPYLVGMAFVGKNEYDSYTINLEAIKCITESIWENLEKCHVIKECECCCKEDYD